MAKINFNQKPATALKYLTEKQPELHFDYDEIMHEAHHKAFTVAKVTKLDLLTDIQKSLVKARDQGQPFEAWKKELIPTLKKKGWYGKTEVTNPKTGEIKEIYVGSRRLRNIFYTNTRVAYNVGRWEHQDQLEDAPYLRYVAILDNRNRPSHGKNHGVVRHKDDPFWATNYPPNGWNCRCRVQAYSMDSLKSRGWDKGLKAPVHNVADKDWAYDVRTGSRARVEAYRSKRVLDAPKGLKDAAKETLALDEALKESYVNVPTVLQTYLLTHRPKQIVDSSIKNRAIYTASEQTIHFKSYEDIDILTYRHELGHHIDNINNFFSIAAITKTLKRDQLIWKQNKHLAEIDKLSTNPEDIAIHDIIYLVSKRKHGEPTRKDNYEIKPSKTAKEVFANIFEMILTDDHRLDIIRKYFPSTVAKVEELIKGLK